MSQNQRQRRKKSFDQPLKELTIVQNSLTLMFSTATTPRPVSFHLAKSRNDDRWKAKVFSSYEYIKRSQVEL